MASVTADGDAAVHSLVKQIFGDDVVSHQDPNHYTKGLEKSFKPLVEQHPSLATIKKKIKSHFLISSHALLSHIPTTDHH